MLPAEKPADDLESAIDTATLRLATAATPELRREAWSKLQSLVSQRTPERVLEMEIAQGLADRALDRIDATRIHDGQTLEQFAKK